MPSTAEPIPLARLAIAFLPVLAVLVIMHIWSLGFRTAMHGVLRMLAQLTLVGYLLGYIFETELPLVVMGVLLAMTVAASAISMRSVTSDRMHHLLYSLCSIIVGGGLTLVIMTQGVLGLDPWYLPQKLIPLAGMTFANCMNTVSLAAERYAREIERQESHRTARETSMRAAFIPITNGLFAVGLVSIPGMMTGQVLAGVSPLIAARYQIMVMCMIFGSGGLSSAIYLSLVGRRAAAMEAESESR